MVVKTVNSQTAESLSGIKCDAPTRCREEFWSYDASTLSEVEVAELTARLSNDLDATSPYEFSESEITHLLDLHNCLKQSREERERREREGDEWITRLDQQLTRQAGGW